MLAYHQTYPQYQPQPQPQPLPQQPQSQPNQLPTYTNSSALQQLQQLQQLQHHQQLLQSQTQQLPQSKQPFQTYQDVLARQQQQQKFMPQLQTQQFAPTSFSSSMVMPMQSSQQINPPIRLQQSTPPVNQVQPSILSHSALSKNNSLHSQDALLNPFQPRQVSHNRASSNSSVGSSSPYSGGSPSFSGSNSPWSGQQQQHTPAASRQFSLPTPADTPIQFNFSTGQDGIPFSQDAGLSNFNNDMKRTSWGGQTATSADDDAASYTYSGAPSVSSVGQNSPPTPQNFNTDHDFDDGSKMMSTDLIPKLDRTTSDAYNDMLLFDSPSIAVHPAPRPVNRPANMAQQTGHNLVNDRIQAAQKGHITRSQSPVVLLSRDRSPFRPTSDMSQDFQQNVSRLALHNQNQAEDIKTISPKEAMLDYNDEDQPDMPSMMPPAQPASMAIPPQTPYYTAADSNFSTNPYLQIHKQQVPQAKPFPVVNAPRAEHFLKMEDLPEFPTTLTTMDSTASEASAPTSAPSSLPSSQQSQQSQHNEIKRPDDLYDNGGTYSCTYHNCTLRFESPVKLQRHKRDAHRHTSPSSGGKTVVDDPDNTQSGPHECHRLKPNGEPCNSVFSRPYDLTRHEDTIHNPKKQKVSCHICQEDKMFSRADALGRHMRAVHPEINWPGKKVRKNARK